ncbi:FitA-like ribbon-helix-helix domain-containing protein [Reyranella sp.]|uniref:FitA-like ribbon-helix-helix domain-containing protein n=1 Tax=Reyranella sp. TaxID=1929291 RepID=UPI003BAB3C4E
MDTATAHTKRGTTLTIRGLDVAIIERLKNHARARGRSLEADLRDLLTYASGQPLVVDPLEEADRIAAMTPRVNVTHSGADA